MFYCREAYYELVDEFVNAVQQRYPAALIQFEDFSPDKAVPVLEKYRDQVLSFNDDIQGTGMKNGKERKREGERKDGGRYTSNPSGIG